MVYHLRGRWKEVEEIQLQELRASTVKQNWQKLNAIMLRAKRLKLARENDNSELEVFMRWAKLKGKYESFGRLTTLS